MVDHCKEELFSRTLELAIVPVELSTQFIYNCFLAKGINKMYSFWVCNVA